jgi:divalent metal cation (Fe/Co/Zn/Cd) transporter
VIGNGAKSREEKWWQLAFALGIFTIVYNLAEGIVATWLGYEDETLALFGFGLDSFIEMISGFGIVQMVLRIRRQPQSRRSPFEVTALRITGTSFYLLAAGLTVSAVLNIVWGRIPVTTFWGVVISSVSIGIMAALIYGKLRAGRALNSAPLVADARCSQVCIYMSVVLLLSSLIYETTGFAYADSLGTLGLAWFSLTEGRECFEKAAARAHCDC